MVFLKWPEPGRVKTRLAAAVGEREAAEVYRMLLAAVVAGIPAALPVWFVFDPAEREADVRGWLAADAENRFGEGRVSFVAQRPGDLGARLAGAFGDAFGAGFKKVAVVGTDCVEITSAIYDEVWQGLDSVDAVFGPATDGGYYLLGLARFDPALFEGIPWSTGETLGRSVDAALAAGFRVVFTRELADVDTVADWERVRGLILG